MRQAAELAPDALVVHVGVVGSPDVVAERLLSGADLARAVEAVASQVGASVDALGIIEIGGLNALLPPVAAVELGLPVVDGDLMGRAFPHIRQTTLATAGMPPTPVALVDPSGSTAVFTTGTAARVESLVAACAGAMGGAATVALHPASAATLAELGVPGSLTACIRAGEAYLTAPPGDSARLAAQLGGILLFEGRVDDVAPREDGAPGSLTLTHDATATTVRVDFLTEFLAVTVDAEPVALTPEVVVIVNTHDFAILNTDQVRLGQSVSVIALPPLHRWPDEARRLVGPAGYGLDLQEGM